MHFEVHEIGALLKDFLAIICFISFIKALTWLDVLTRFLIVLEFNDTSTLVGHFVSSPKKGRKRDRRESKRDEREGQGRKRNKSESEV